MFPPEAESMSPIAVLYWEVELPICNKSYPDEFSIRVAAFALPTICSVAPGLSWLDILAETLPLTSMFDVPTYKELAVPSPSSIFVGFPVNPDALDVLIFIFQNVELL